MSAPSYTDVLRDDIYIHDFDDQDFSWPSAVALYAQHVQDALRLPDWIKSVGQVCMAPSTSIPDLFNITHRVPILTSRSAHFLCSTSYVTLTAMYHFISPRLTMICTDVSRQPSESRSAIVQHSGMF